MAVLVGSLQFHPQSKYLHIEAFDPRFYSSWTSAENQPVHVFDPVDSKDCPAVGLDCGGHLLHSRLAGLVARDNSRLCE
jgi:hypothetical protein